LERNSKDILVHRNRFRTLWIFESLEKDYECV